MTQTSERTPAPGLGHNMPPDPLQLLREGLAERHAQLLEEISAALDGFTAKPVRSDAAQEKAATAAMALTALRKRVEKAHEVEKKPYLDGGRVVDAWKNEHANPLATAIKALDDEVMKYMKAKAAEARRVAEEEARAAAAAAEAERQKLVAAAQAADMDALETARVAMVQHEVVAEKAAAEAATPVRIAAVTGSGIVLGVRTEVGGRILDRALAAPLLAPFIDAEALAKAAKAYAKLNEGSLRDAIGRSQDGKLVSHGIEWSLTSTLSRRA